MPLNAVLDSTILISAFLTPGGIADAVLQGAIENRFTGVDKVLSGRQARLCQSRGAVTTSKASTNMSDSASIAFMSPNFAFLAKYDDVLVHHAALAERYVFDDPNAALIKLRQFGELLAQHAAAYTGIAVEARTAQRDLIDQLWDDQIINAQASTGQPMASEQLWLKY